MENFFIKKIINLLIKHGKKNRAKQLLFNSFFLLKFQYNVSPIIIFIMALQNFTPVVEFSSYKKGSKTVLLPKVTNYRRRLSLGIRWLVMKVKKSKKKDSSKLLAFELFEGSQCKGEIFSKKMAVHKKVGVYKIFK